MFGHIRPDLHTIQIDEKARYEAMYCGLCHTLNDRHGKFSKLGLTYDLTFLLLLLSSLYEAEETFKTHRCPMRKCKKHVYCSSNISIYVSDITIALIYHKCLDDWYDDRSLFKRLYALLLSREYKAVRTKWPTQCRSIEEGLARLSELESADHPDPDAASNCFGSILSELFIYKNDQWEKPLRKIGFSIGKYIYIADAAIDYDEDMKKKKFNPLTEISHTPEDLRPTLTAILGEASEGFEYLPLVKDSDLLRNILYSGLWTKFEQAANKQRKDDKHGRRSIFNSWRIKKRNKG